MNDRDEQHWERGYRAAWVAILADAVRHLGIDDPEAKGKAWIKEREETVEKLRQVCDEHGDNDWPNNLHLTDVIEKHLYRHLPQKP